jgi:RND family efflux transporter MFP subunit
MLPITACLLSLILTGVDPSTELKIDSAQLTLIEHADISANEAGLLNEISVKEGETVEVGDTLAVIDGREAELLCQRAETEVEEARSLAENDIKVRFAKLSAAVADAELKRAKESHEKFPKSVSQTELDRLKLLADKSVLEVEQAQADLQQARRSLRVKEHDLERTRLALRRRTIVAPFPGMVVQWKKQRGEWVEPGTPVMRLIRINRLRAEAFVASQSLPAKLIDRPVILIVQTPAANGEPATTKKHEGKLVFVSPEVDPVNGQVRIWAEIDNSDLSLRPGQSAALVIGPAN